MESRKIPCSQCNAYNTCSYHTRVYVNYCGGQQALNSGRIREAREDCMRNRGYFYRRLSIPQYQAAESA